MSAKIEGIMCAADLETTQFATKSGYWLDGWMQVMLSKYTTMSSV